MYRIFIARGIGPQGGWTVVLPALSISLHTSYTGKLQSSVYDTPNHLHLFQELLFGGFIVRLHHKISVRLVGVLPQSSLH